MKKIKLLKNRNFQKILGVLGVTGMIVGTTSAVNISNKADNLEFLTKTVKNNNVAEYEKASANFEIKSGESHSGILFNGDLYLWGSNAKGQLGNGTKQDSFSPIKVNGLPGPVDKFELGGEYSSAVVNGDLYTWGNNDNGQLGIGSNAQTELWPKLVSTLKGVGEIGLFALGKNHASAFIGGQLYSWGKNNAGQLGITSDTTNKNIPTKASFNKNITNLSLGDSHSAAVVNGDELYTWGANNSGQLGNKKISSNPTTTPTKVTSPIPDGYISGLSVKGDWSAMIMEDSSGSGTNTYTLYTWGSNTFGQLGLGDDNLGKNINEPTPIPLNTGGDYVYQLVTSATNAAVVINNKLYMWGDNEKGQLGNDTPSIPSIHEPTIITSFSEPIAKISLGFKTSFVYTEGKLFAWGWNDGYKLGLGFQKLNDPIVWKPEPWSTIYKKNTLNQNNDIDNLRDRFVNSIDKVSELESLLNQSKLELGFVDSDQFSDTTLDTFTTGQLKVEGEKDKAILVIITTVNRQKYSITFDGFNPVTPSKNIILNAAKILDTDTHFENYDIYDLIDEAKLDLSGKSSYLAKWIISTNIIIGNNSQNPSILPSNAQIVKASDFKILSVQNGTIGCKIWVKNIYVYNSQNKMIVDTTTPETELTNPIEIQGFNKIKPSQISQKSEWNKSFSAYDLLMNKFKYQDDNTDLSEEGLVWLKEYVNLDNFPPLTKFKLINHELINNSIKFKIEANQYYDVNLDRHNTPFTSGFLMIDDLFDATTNITQNLIYPTNLSPIATLNYLGYNNGTNQNIDKIRLEEYFTIESLPANAKLELGNVTQNDNSLTFEVLANPHYLISGEPIKSPKGYGLITFDGLPKAKNTEIIYNLDANKKILTGELIKIFGWDDVNFSFNKDEVAKYVSLSPLPDNATVLMKNLRKSNDSGDVYFNFEVDSYYKDDQQIETRETYSITIDGLETVTNSDDNTDFVKTEISGNGTDLSNEIESEFKENTVIKYDNPTWSKLFNVNTYPPIATFTIKKLESINFNIYKTFKISFIASHIYSNNTIVENSAVSSVDINNLQFTPTGGFRPVDTDYPKDVTYEEFYTYINYESTTGSFDPDRLQKFIILDGFDLTNPGTTVKMIDIEKPTQSRNIIFKLKTQYYVNSDGIGVNLPKTFDIDFAWTQVPIIPPGSSNLSTPKEITLIATIGGAGGIVIMFVILGSLIKHKSNKK